MKSTEIKKLQDRVHALQNLLEQRLLQENETFSCTYPFQRPKIEDTTGNYEASIKDAQRFSAAVHTWDGCITDPYVDVVNVNATADESIKVNGRLSVLQGSRLPMLRSSGGISAWFRHAKYSSYWVYKSISPQRRQKWTPRRDTGCLSRRALHVVNRRARAAVLRVAHFQTRPTSPLALVAKIASFSTC
ncbi:hypothetical protein DFS33DRAFT_1086768 [Desarmillaria ectypa]|nr:hypothetical protein DFS33DRAFT_1086768 [Desarmillaria ectypa]